MNNSENDLQDLIIRKALEISELVMTLKKKNSIIEKLEEELLDEREKNSEKKENRKNSYQLNKDIIQNDDESNIIGIFRLYQKLLLRNPDPEGFAGFTNAVLAGKTIKWVEEQIKSSDEYKRINRL